MPTKGAAALDRGLDLLLAIIADGGAAPLAAQARALGIPLSTARRLALAFERRGLLMKGEYGHRLPGLALSGFAHDPLPLLAAAARPLLRGCARRIGQTLHLGVFDVDMVTYLVKAPGGAPIFTREAMQLEAYCSAIGKVLLAAMPAAQRAAYLAAGPFVALTPRTLTDPAQLRAELDAVAAAGHAVDDRAIAADLHCIAVPLRDMRGNVIAAISASRRLVPGADPDPDARLAALQACATAIEARIAPRLPAPGQLV